MRDNQKYKPDKYGELPVLHTFNEIWNVLNRANLTQHL